MQLEMTILARIPELIPVTDLRQDAAAILKRVESSSQPLVESRGHATASAYPHPASVDPASAMAM